MFLLDDIVRWLKGREEDSGAIGSQILEALPLPLLVCDKSLFILRANPAFTRHFKVDEDHLKGKTALQILGNNIKMIEERDGWPIKERQVNPGDLDLLIGGANPKILEGNFPKIGQRVFRLHTRKAFSLILLVFEEITKAREMNDKIQKSRQELLSVFDGIEDPVVMIDRDYRIRRINEAMLRAVGGNSYKGFIGKACWYKLHGLERRCPGCTADRTFATGKKTSRLGLLQARANAEDFTYQISCYPLRDTAGKVTGIAEGYRDVTDVQKVEEELRESERSRLVESLAAGIAHEVRNPIAVIRSTAQYCLGESGENPDMKESLQTIIKSSDGANRVLSALLDFARPQEINIRRHPLRSILEEGLRFIKGRAKLQKVRTVKVVSRHLPIFSFDKNRFLQAYLNLLTNSLDAMPHGGTLTVEARPKKDPQGCRIIVRDTGRGIPEEMLPRILRPFYTTRKEGVGLGLPIAEGIIRSQGGRMAFRSREGKGTEVTIFLPVKGRIPL